MMLQLRCHTKTIVAGRRRRSSSHLVCGPAASPARASEEQPRAAASRCRIRRRRRRIGVRLPRHQARRIQDPHVPHRFLAARRRVVHPLRHRQERRLQDVRSAVRKPQEQNPRPDRRRHAARADRRLRRPRADQVPAADPARACAARCPSCRSTTSTSAISRSRHSRSRSRSRWEAEAPAEPRDYFAASSFRQNVAIRFHVDGCEPSSVAGAVATFADAGSVAGANVGIIIAPAASPDFPSADTYDANCACSSGVDFEHVADLRLRRSRLVHAVGTARGSSNRSRRPLPNDTSKSPSPPDTSSAPAPSAACAQPHGKPVVPAELDLRRATLDVVVAAALRVSQCLQPCRLGPGTQIVLALAAVADGGELRLLAHQLADLAARRPAAAAVHAVAGRRRPIATEAPSSPRPRQTLRTIARMTLLFRFNASTLQSTLNPQSINNRLRRAHQSTCHRMPKMFASEFGTPAFTKLTISSS